VTNRSDISVTIVATTMNVRKRIERPLSTAADCLHVGSDGMFDLLLIKGRRYKLRCVHLIIANDC